MKLRAFKRRNSVKNYNSFLKNKLIPNTSHQMQLSTHSDSDDKEVTQIDYYKLNPVEKDEIVKQVKEAVISLNKLDVKSSKDAKDFVQKIFDDDTVSAMLIYLSKLPVFSKEFAEAMKHNLDLLAITK